MTVSHILGLTKGRGVGVALCAALTVLAGCSSEHTIQPAPEPGFEVVASPRTAQMIWHSGYQFIRIDNVEGNTPPVGEAGDTLGLNADGMRKALAAVRFVKNGEESNPVFTPSDIEKLAEPLAQALAATKPGQDVVFSIYHTGGMLLFGQHALIGGRVFAENGSLDIIFGQANAMPPTIRTGSRKSQTEVDYAVLVQPYVSHGGNNRSDWARIAPEAWRPALAAPVVPVAPVALPNASDHRTGLRTTQD